MKLTSKILIGLLLLLCCGILLSASLFKSEYEKNDKGELYFLYGTIADQPFSHLVITGGNVSNIVYEPGAKSSVRVFKRWNGYHDKRIATIVRNDTLFLDFPAGYADLNEKMQLKNTSIVRIFSPELKSVDATNTNLQLLKLKQKTLAVSIGGNSNFEVESMIADFDDISIKATDTTGIVFEMSPDLKKSGSTVLRQGEMEIAADKKGWDAFHIRKLSAIVSGHSFVDVGHAQIDSVDFQVADSSAIVLSGGAIQQRLQGK
ncbi:hypothetical protein [Chitinophaga sp. Cy-1792]|uniref:hypothetical protein n=1 Tax=Chitinophaga sp. Cy-1792 TaxID=2608339 RepID=UPI001423589F|nr:hypothetical protein [Chitinophaga sp. Cy-1792]NIG55667.1 hypothetical protein [Chitinophaga sp. Cy-1792]